MNGLEAGTILARRYKVISEIGRGGMGVVYRVEHVNTGELFALKVLTGSSRDDPQTVARFKREARTATKIRSEHVVRVIDADAAPELDGSPFLVMELLQGLDLEQRVTRDGALAPATILPILAEVAEVLGAAHAQGIIHRDLKPENVFLHEREDGTTIAKVLDFGISKFVSEEAELESGQLTASGALLGTPLYMAPEQALAEHDAIDARTDVWALGLVTLRLLTGEHYWGTVSMAQLLRAIALNPIVPPSERWPNDVRMTKAIDEWFMRSCARDPAKRFGSVAEQVSELEVALGPASRTLARTETRQAPRPPMRRSSGAIRLVGVVAAVAVAGVLGSSRSRHRVTPPPPVAAEAPPAPTPPVLSERAPAASAEPPPSASGSGSATKAPPRRAILAAPAPRPSPSTKPDPLGDQN